MKHSPYADADPAYRHAFPTLGTAGPMVGQLAPTACEGMAVYVETAAHLPLCPNCLGGRSILGHLIACTSCGSGTRRKELCSMCRSVAHRSWLQQQAE